MSKNIYTIKTFEDKGYTCKVLHWSMLLIYKPYSLGGEDGFEAKIYKFESCDYVDGEDLSWVIPTEGELFIDCIAYYDGLRHLKFYQQGVPSYTLDGDYVSEMLLPAITELKALESKYCVDFTEEK